MRIYVGNLSYDTSETELKEAFEQYGEVESAQILVDKYTNRSRGFAFVEMPDSSQAQAAITGLNGTELSGRTLKVNEARPRDDKNRRPRRDFR